MICSFNVKINIAQKDLVPLQVHDSSIQLYKHTNTVQFQQHVIQN